jgi:hypothetical protein
VPRNLDLIRSLVTATRQDFTAGVDERDSESATLVFQTVLNPTR